MGKPPRFFRVGRNSPSHFSSVGAKTMTDKQTIYSVSTELNRCPFCGHPAKMDAEEIRGDDAWCFIRCSIRCRVAPYVGESACVWYWSEGKKHRSQSDEKAKEQAKERATKAWNTRFEEPSQLQGEVEQLRAELRLAPLREALLEQVKGERDRMIERTQELSTALDDRDALLVNLKHVVAEFAGSSEIARKAYREIDAILATSAEQKL